MSRTITELLDDLVGRSAPMAALKMQVQRLLGRSNEVGGRLPPLLILGETGTGKGLLVRIIHKASIRRDMPLIEVNCAAIPDSLVEAELFGFERGAFTDARQAKPGLFQAANRGVLFLDEVSSLPLPAQAKLLNALEEREVRRLGSTRSESVDVWIVSATNDDLSAAVARGAFRLDLYYRISTIKLEVPPLRDRGGDVVALAEHFLSQACSDYGLSPKRLALSAEGALRNHSWTGNVRELANVMERMALMTDDDEISAELLELSRPGGFTHAAVVAPPMAPKTDRDALRLALEESRWNLSRAAARLGVTRNTLRFRIKRFGLGPGAVEPSGEQGATPASTRAADADRMAPPRLLAAKARVNGALVSLDGLTTPGR